MNFNDADEGQAPLVDNSIMPEGKYKGEKMANVPEQYLRYVYESGKCSRRVKQYVIDFVL